MALPIDGATSPHNFSMGQNGLPWHWAASLKVNLPVSSTRTLELLSRCSNLVVRLDT